MLNWLNWQEKFHDLDTSIRDLGGKNNYISCNLLQETQCVRDWLSHNTYATRKKLHFGSGYIDMLAQDYDEFGVTKQQLQDWIHDSRFEKLMTIAGVATVIDIPGHLRQEIVDNLQNKLPIDLSDSDIYMTRQDPGDMFPLHRDRIKIKDFRSQDCQDETDISRFLIMLYDQEPGQTFQMGNDFLHWRAGDVINWPHHFFQYHGSANFGYWSRFSLRITGKLLQG